MKNECCWRRISGDFLQHELKRVMTVNNRCALSFSTHCMQLFRPKRPLLWTDATREAYKTNEMRANNWKSKLFLIPDAYVDDDIDDIPTDAKVYRYFYQEKKMIIDSTNFMLSIVLTIVVFVTTKKRNIFNE